MEILEVIIMTCQLKNYEEPSFVLFDEKTLKIVRKSHRDEILVSKYLTEDKPVYRPYGIDYDEDYVYVASHEKIVKYCRKTFKFLEVLVDTGYLNTHEIIKEGNSIYRVNTWEESITKINLETKEEKTITFKDSKTGEIGKIEKKCYKHHHLNHIAIRGEYLYILFSKSRKRKTKDGFITRINKNLDLNTCELLEHDLGAQIHDVVFANNKLYNTSAYSSMLIETSFNGNQKRIKLFTRDHYTRGLVRIGNYLYAFGSIWDLRHGNKDKRIAKYARMARYDLSSGEVEISKIEDIKLIFNAKEYK